MKTVIVPVDFSETSLHAASYAGQLLANHVGVSLILYHVYIKDAEAAPAEASLSEIKSRLLEHQFVMVETLNQKEDDFLSSLERTVRQYKADLVIMGITGRSALAQVFIGSNTLKFAERKVCPVLIIPEHAAFREIKNVMFASDFKDTVHSTPAGTIKDFLKNFRPKLHIVNVDPEHYISLTESYDKEKQQLETMFAGLDPEFYFLRLYDIDNAISLFAEEKDIDLIISIQRNHSFREKLFKRSRTKSLSYHSNLPILIVHE